MKKKADRPGKMLLTKKNTKLIIHSWRGWQKKEPNGVDKHRTCPMAEYLKKKNRDRRMWLIHTDITFWNA